MTDIIQFDATFDTVEAAAQALLKNLEGLQARAVEMGDEMEVARLEAMKPQLLGQVAGRQPETVSQKPAIEADNAAIAEGNAERAEAMRLQGLMVDGVDQQAKAEREALAVTEENNAAMAEQVALAKDLLLANRPARGSGGWTEAEIAIQAADAELKVQQTLIARNAELEAQRLVTLQDETGEIAAQIALASEGVRNPGGGQSIYADRLAAEAAAQAAADAAREQAIARQNQLLADQVAAEERIAAETRAASDAAFERSEFISRAANQARGTAFAAGARASASGQSLGDKSIAKATAAPSGLTKDETAMWQAQTAATIEASAAEGTYAGFAAASGRATAAETAALDEAGVAMRGVDMSAEKLSAGFTRLSLSEAESSNTLRKHGALTTEYLGALARGETTVSEFGYQIGATIGKFAGWTAAAAATYGVLGAVVELGKGAIDSSSAVTQLTRTIDGLDKNQASVALQGLSADVNVPMKEAGDAVFAFSRTFHTLDGAVTAARLALAAYKLDGVSVADSVKASTAISQQFGVTAAGLTPVYDELAQGQQKFNARISDQIPLLQRSAAAVKNAGGNLSDFIKISTIFLRTTQLSGSQGGTAFSRSAGTFLNPDTPKGQTDRAVLQKLGINPNQGYTDVILDALKKSATLTPDDRKRLSLAVFGPLLGTRTAGFFGGGGAALVPTVGNELSPAGSKGVLNTELKKELSTTSQEMTAFVNGLQQIGAALANSGALVGFGVALKVVDAALVGVRDVIDIFDKLPSSTKEVIAGLVELRLAMLFLSRTKFGGSIADATGLSAVGRATGLNRGAIGRFGLGLGNTEETKNRQALQQGSRGALQKLNDNVAATVAEQNTNQAVLLELEQKRATIENEMTAAGERTVVNLNRSNAVMVEMAAIAAEQTELAGKQAFQEKAAAITKAKLVSYGRIGRTSGRADDATVNRDAAAMRATGDPVTIVPAGTAAASQAKAWAASVEANTAEQGRLKIAQGLEVTALEENAIASEESAALMVRTNAAMAEMRAAQETKVLPAIEEGEGGLTRLASGIGGMASALDPLTIGLVALPFVFSALKSSSNDVLGALKKSITSAEGPITSFAQLAKNAAILKAATKKYADLQKNPDEVFGKGTFDTGGLSNIGSHITGALGDAGSWLLSKTALGGAQAPGAPPKQDITTAPFTTLAGLNGGKNVFPTDPTNAANALENEKNTWTAVMAAGTKDAKFAKDTTEGRQEFYNKLNMLKAKVQAIAAFNNPDSKSTKSWVHAMDVKIQTLYEDKQAQFSAFAQSKSPFASFKQFTTAQLTTQMGSLDDRTKIFGAQGSQPDLKKATEIYAYLAQQVAREGKNAPDADLKQLATAQASLVSVENKLVADLVASAASATTLGGQTADLNEGYQAIQTERADVAAGLALAIKAAKGNNRLIRLARETASQQLVTINAQLSSVLTPQLAQIDASTATTVAGITGTSTEADIARSRATLSGLQQKLAKTESEGGSVSDVTDLENQISTAKQGIVTSLQTQADTLADAAAQLSLSSIMGLGPAADMARARQSVQIAQNKLARDKSEGKDAAVLMADQAAIDDSLQALASTAQQNAQTLASDLSAAIDANVALQQSRTTDPVKQAQEQLAGDIKHLQDLSRSQFQTQQEYITAVKNAQAKVNTDRQAKQEQIASTDEANANFELATQQISDAAYVAQLEQILKLKKLSKTTRQRLEQEIYSATHDSSDGGVELNAGNIKIPSLYTIRKAIALGKAGVIPGSPSTVISHTSNITVNVYDGKHAAKVGKAIDDALNSTVKVAMRAKGVG